jgi:hypothetical protein
MPAAASYSASETYESGRVVKVKGTTSYTTGGYDLPAYSSTPASGAPIVALNDGGAVIGLVAAGKVKFITASTGAEVADASDQSANTVQVLVP